MKNLLLNIEKLFNSTFTERYNPLYHLGAIAVFLLWPLFISGIYLFIFVFFAQALKVDPNNEKMKKYYNDAEVRANARVEDFLNESIRSRFIQAQQLVQNSQYAQALEILEAIQQEQRYNKRILDAIDLARDRMKK